MINKKLLLLLCLFLVLCTTVLIVFGQTYTMVLSKEKYFFQSIPSDTSLIHVQIENEDPGVEITGYSVEDDNLIIRFSSIKQGKTSVAVYFGNQPQTYFHLYTHPFGVITYESVFGDSTGDIVIPLALLIYLAAIIYLLIKRLCKDVRQSMYQYRNVMELGLIVFLCFFLLYLVHQCFNYHGLIDSVNNFLDVIHIFSMIVLPVAFVLSLLVTASNISLMQKEGRTWRNMLGIFLGICLCILTLMPTALGEYLQWSPNPIMDVHNEKGAGLYIEKFTEGVISMLVSYLECILIGTVVFGVKAARYIPAFDKDYILILGCQIKDDGTLTPLLRSRTDKALEFARMQKEKTGKDIVFVPSGGKGPDEITAEADAIAAYLHDSGVPEDRIIPENASTDTYENIRYSMKLIREHTVETEPKVAFSTTNYHVFRAGMIAHELDERLEGIGSPTKRYFWVNAFVREFIATLVSERKKHILIVFALTVLILFAVIIKYLSVLL